MAEYLIQEETLTGIADAIRSKTGSTESIAVGDMAEAIGGIETGGGALKVKRYYQSLNGSYGARVSIDFGFTPLFLVVVPAKNTSIANSVDSIFIGTSSALSTTDGNYIGSAYMYFYSNKAYYNQSSSTIDGTNVNSAIYNCDATGFNFGTQHISGYAYIYAVGI